jgi:hypothetical protein
MSAENIFFFGLPWPKGHDRSVKATDGAGFDGPPYFGLHSSHDINCDGFFFDPAKKCLLGFLVTTTSYCIYTPRWPTEMHYWTRFRKEGN